HEDVAQAAARSGHDQLTARLVGERRQELVPEQLRFLEKPAPRLPRRWRWQTAAAEVDRLIGDRIQTYRVDDDVGSPGLLDDGERAQPARRIQSVGEHQDERPALDGLPRRQRAEYRVAERRGAVGLYRVDRARDGGRVRGEGDCELNDVRKCDERSMVGGAQAGDRRTRRNL